MSADRRDLISLVEKLRQEQEFILFYKTQIRQTIQDVNHCCDTVFQSLWLNQCLAHGLEKVKVHQAQGLEWGRALEQVQYVKFVDAAKTLKSGLLIENYGKYLDALINSPSLLAEMLHWAESEGLDTSCLISDLMSVIFGHCVFQHDHTLLLSLLKELMRKLVSCASTPKELFSGVEPIFCRVLTDYCNQLVDLRTFLTEAFQEPLMEVLSCEDYLEYDVTKAGSRFQSNTESQNNHFLNSSTFLFSEDLESSCKKLAHFAGLYLDGVHRLASQFPLSLKWVLGSLKVLIRNKWPDISAMELRRPISAVLFGPVLGSAIVNPDSHGISELNVVVGPVARYNLSQVTSVLQGFAWVLGKQGGKYPIQKVIKKMNTRAYYSLLDSLDGGYGGELLDLPSSLPGLRRSAYLASQTQLNNLLGLLCVMVDALAEKADSAHLHDRLADLKRQLPPPMMQLASPAPYALQPISFPGSVRPQPQRAESVEVQGGKTGTKRRERLNTEMVRSPTKTGKKYSQSTSSINLVGASGTTSSSGSRTFTRSTSPKPLLYASESSFSLFPSQNPPGNFSVPSEVLILPISTDMAAIGSLRQKTTLWDFAILSEEEFMSQHQTPTFKRISPDLSKIPPPSSSSSTATPTPDRPHPPPSSPKPPHNPLPSNTTPTSSPERPNVAIPDDTEPGHQGHQCHQNGVEHTDSGPTHNSPTHNGPTHNGPTDNDPTHNGPTHNGPTHNGPTHNGHTHIGHTHIGPTHSGTAAMTPPISRAKKSHLMATGSEPSLNLSSRESSMSPRTAPKKRSFTITSIGDGKFSLNSDLSPLLRKSADSLSTASSSRAQQEVQPSPSPSPHHFSSPPSSHSPSTILTPPPPTNDVDHPKPEQLSPRTPNTAHLKTPQESDRDSVSDDPPPSELSPRESQSVEDLVGEVEGTPGSKRTTWRILWRKKRKKKTKRKSIDERGTKEGSASKPRSKSLISADGQTEGDDSKVRSKSEPDQESKRIDEGLESPPQAAHKVRRSYTIIAAPIMAKYTAIIKEQKRLGTAPVNEDELSSPLPRYESVKVREMSPHTFQQSLFCKQLKYKLRAAMQSIHTPLTSSPVYLQLLVDEDSKCDSKSQLTTLLQCALQRSKWYHDNMGIALLTETLRMVEQLPNSLVGVTVEGAHEQHARRTAYTKYLMQSHLKFQDVRLQVGAMQAAVDRMQEVLKEQFVQFSTQQFLQQQESELAEFAKEVDSLTVTDEKCLLMEQRLESFTDALLEDQTWRYWPKDDIVTVTHCLEDHLFAHVYNHVFHPNMELDREKDKIFSDHLTKLAEGLTPVHKSLQISLVYHSGCPWTAAQKHLKAMALFKSPRGKVHCIVESCRVLISLLQYAKVGSPPGADDLFPVLVYVLIKANPPSLLSTVQYIRNFLEDQLMGEENYWWAQFSTAVEFTKTLE